MSDNHSKEKLLYRVYASFQETFYCEDLEDYKNIGNGTFLCVYRNSSLVSKSYLNTQYIYGVEPFTKEN